MLTGRFPFRRTVEFRGQVGLARRQMVETPWNAHTKVIYPLASDLLSRMFVPEPWLRASTFEISDAAWLQGEK